MARRAHSLQTLLNQVNQAYPGRNKASDGWIADANHAVTSDHQPDKNGIVKAQDLTHDPAHGLDGNVLAPLWAKDPRTNYTIFNRRIYQNGTNKPYYGNNPHDKHVHVSVKDSVKDQTQNWQLNSNEKEKDVALSEAARYMVIRGILGREPTRDEMTSKEFDDTELLVRTMWNNGGSIRYEESKKPKPPTSVNKDTVIKYVEENLK